MIYMQCMKKKNTCYIKTDTNNANANADTNADIE